jgi:arginine decarboxylase
LLDDEEVHDSRRKTVMPLTEIRISTGVGVAETQLSAFDAALYEAGIGDVNLLPLSSVIPPGADVMQKQPDLTGTEWGDRLYVVLAEQGASAVGEQAWAGIGWIQEPDGRRRGLFVEHHGSSEAEVEDLIHASLGSMREYRPEVFGPVQSVLRGARCAGRPVSALVAATYQSQPW